MCVWGNALIKLHAYYDIHCFACGRREAFDSVCICFFKQNFYEKQNSLNIEAV